MCGTGGDGHHTLNVSTAVSLVVAALGVPVAKHGNRAASSKAGAADTLEVLGLDMERAGAVAQSSLNDIGIAFLFAANHHPAMARITPIRRRIGRRTIFNLMGPLANPAHVGRQLIGIARPDYATVYAEALEQLGAEAALVVSGEEGWTSCPARVPASRSRSATSRRPRPSPPRMRACPAIPSPPFVAATRGTTPRRFAASLAGEPGAYRDAVLLNAAAALLVAGHSTDLRQGAVAAARAIDTGEAAALLDRWIAYR